MYITLRILKYRLTQRFMEVYYVEMNGLGYT